MSPCCHAVGPRGVHWPAASTSSGWTLYPLGGPRRFSGSVALSGLFSLQLQVGGAAYCQGPLLYLRGPPWDCMPCVLRPICVYRLAVCAGSLSLLWLLFLAVRSRLSPRSVAAGPAGAGAGAGGTRCEGKRFGAAACALCALRASPLLRCLTGVQWGPVILPLRWLWGAQRSFASTSGRRRRLQQVFETAVMLAAALVALPPDYSCVPCVAPARGCPCVGVLCSMVLCIGLCNLSRR